MSSQRSSAEATVRKPPPRKPRRTEHAVQTQIERYLRALGCVVLRTNAGKIQNALTKSWVQLCDTGTADLHAILPGGMVVAIECKAKGGRLSAEQRAYLERVGSWAG